MSAFTLSATHAVAKTAGLRAKTQVRTSFASRVYSSNPPAPLLDRPRRRIPKRHFSRFPSISIARVRPLKERLTRRIDPDTVHPSQAKSSVRRAVTTKAAVKVGDAAPDFALMGEGFEVTKLSDLKGSKVVLAFFPAAFSGDADGGCQCQLQALQSIAKTDGVKVLGICKDQPFAMGVWKGVQGIDCLSDWDLSASEKYVGTLDFGEFLDSLDVSTNFKGYMACRRGCVVLDEDQKVVYSWNGMPDQLPDTTEIQAALGIGKTDFA